MRTFNKVLIMGHLASDVDFRQTKTGKFVSTFPLTTNRVVKGDDGEQSEVADFHRVVAWGGLAEVSNKYLSKGSAVFVEGKIINSSFDDKEGRRHFRTEIIADNINIITWKRIDQETGEISIQSEGIEEKISDSKNIAKIG